MTTFQLQRLAYIIRKTVEMDLKKTAPGIRLEAVAEELGHGFAAYLKATVLGQQKSTCVTIDIPDGRWQALKAAFGLPYRKKCVTFTLSVLFPAFEPTLGGAKTTLTHHIDSSNQDAT